MLLQVHDELVFDLYRPENQHVAPLIEEKMKTAIPLDVPIVVEMGVGENWLAAPDRACGNPAATMLEIICTGVRQLVVVPSPN